MLMDLGEKDFFLAWYQAPLSLIDREELGADCRPLLHRSVI